MFCSIAISFFSQYIGGLTFLEIYLLVIVLVLMLQVHVLDVISLLLRGPSQ